MFKTLGLYNKHILLYFPITESGFNTHLPYFIIMKCNYGKEYPDRLDLSQWREGFIIFKYLSLNVTLLHMFGFECVHIPIHVCLLLEDPSTTYCLKTRCRFNQIPNLIFIHGLNFAVHCLSPFGSLRACHGLLIVRKFTQIGRCIITDQRDSSRSNVETIKLRRITNSRSSSKR